MKILFNIFFICLMVLFTVRAESKGGGDIIFRPENPNAKKVLFSHDHHVEVKGIKCSSCHYQIFQMAKGSYQMQMDKITKGEFCGKCHNGEKAFDVKDKNNCKRCHNQ